MTINQGKEQNFTEILMKWLNVYITNHIKKERKHILKYVTQKKIPLFNNQWWKNAKFDVFW